MLGLNTTGHTRPRPLPVLSPLHPVPASFNGFVITYPTIPIYYKWANRWVRVGHKC